MVRVLKCCYPKGTFLIPSPTHLGLAKEAKEVAAAKKEVAAALGEVAATENRAN